ncbi:MAG: DASS family sodium-coupled anion symporter [Chlorobi bacterium CHB2]|nr:DASS family sodium-coupled anion symporter [Chlorobi bacterium CHB2]
MHALDDDSTSADPSSLNALQPGHRLLRWGIVVACGVGIALIPAPEGVSQQSWNLLAIFAATIVGSIVRPISSGAIVLIGVVATIIAGVMPGKDEAARVASALKGYADPIVWLVLAAFFISSGMVKTGLGRRIALLFIRALGRRSIGLGYSLIATDMLLASVIPSNTARSGGIIFPIARSVCHAYDSHPGPTAGRLGAFLMPLLYQCDVIICAMFLTGQASNALIAKFAKGETGLELGYAQWLLAAIVPGIVALLVVPFLLYRINPPQVKETPDAATFADGELKKMGKMGRSEWIMLAVFLLIGTLWMTKEFHSIHYSAVALLGIAVLLLARVLEWEELMAEREAWDVFIWYGGLVRMAEALSESGITRKFAEATATLTGGWEPWAALLLLVAIYFYAHYAFASITAHATAMYIPFIVVVMAAGAPPWIAVLLLAAASNLSAGLTHYGTTPAPIYFGAGYVTQRKWWQLGFAATAPALIIWGTIGVLWWKLLGLW